MPVSDSSPTAFRARYLLPLSSPPIENGIVHIRNRKIERFGRYDSRESNVRDLGDVALLPSLVNAHTHLEFSSLESPLGTASPDLGRFTDWIGQVIAYRQDRDADNPLAHGAAVTQGLVESQEVGVGLLGEIASIDDWPSSESDTDPRISVVRFLELIGLGRERIADQMQRAESFLAAVDVRWQRGLSPHAPYSVALELVRWCAGASKRHEVPLAMHLAETREELEFLATQSGPFRELLESRKVWHAAAFEPGLRPLDYLKILSEANRALIIHGNYLQPDEWAFLAQHRDSMTLVYCPRTHAYFGHEPYPLAKILAANVAVAIGTDSRASNPDLNVWEELQFVSRHHPDVRPESILRMGTHHGADALGASGSYGQISAGRPSRLISVELNSDCRSDCPYEWLFASGGVARRV